MVLLARYTCREPSALLPPKHSKPRRVKESLSASHRPHIVAATLAVGVDVADAEVHVPRADRAGGVGGSRPIVVGLHAGERMTQWQRRIKALRIDQAFQLLEIWKTPIGVAT